MTLMAEYVSHLLTRAIASPQTGKFTEIALTGYAIALVGATFLVAAWLLHLPEMTMAVDRVRRMARKLPVIGHFA